MSLYITTSSLSLPNITTIITQPSPESDLITQMIKKSTANYADMPAALPRPVPLKTGFWNIPFCDINSPTTRQGKKKKRKKRIWPLCPTVTESTLGSARWAIRRGRAARWYLRRPRDSSRNKIIAPSKQTRPNKDLTRSGHISLLKVLSHDLISNWTAFGRTAGFEITIVFI